VRGGLGFVEQNRYNNGQNPQFLERATPVGNADVWPELESITLRFEYYNSLSRYAIESEFAAALNGPPFGLSSGFCRQRDLTKEPTVSLQAELVLRLYQSPYVESTTWSGRPKGLIQKRLMAYIETPGAQVNAWICCSVAEASSHVSKALYPAAEMSAEAASSLSQLGLADRNAAILKPYSEPARQYSAGPRHSRLIVW